MLRYNRKNLKHYCETYFVIEDELLDRIVRFHLQMVKDEIPFYRTVPSGRIRGLIEMLQLKVKEGKATVVGHEGKPFRRSSLWHVENFYNYRYGLLLNDY